MKNLIFSIPLVALALLTGCATTERSMSGKTGCLEDDIQIIDSSPGFGITATTWRISCRGQRFVCSLGPNQKDLDEMSCSPEVGQSSL
ncbi:MAG: hypothetical protein ABL958_16120 [Bdellovibrionia bacterium]